MTAVAKTSSNFKLLAILSSERMLHKDYNRKCSVGKSNYSVMSVKGVFAEMN
jgi:hypothetical protein